jgi:uncharacterized protein YbcC (UPF0753/DUF2309 family)
MSQHHLSACIEEASRVIGKTWPLYSFVTSNPLSGYETMPFREALKSAKDHLNANVFPEAAEYRKALKEGAIDENMLRGLLEENGLSDTPDSYLRKMQAVQRNKGMNPHHRLDRIMAKWLAAFMDEGLAEWEMPGKSEGFYRAWRKLASYDGELGKLKRSQIPKTAGEALSQILKGYSKEECTQIFTYHLAALPGWTGYINHRVETNSAFQQAYPISLEEYLGVRLWLAQHLKVRILPEKKDRQDIETELKLPYLWLKAWEWSWQKKLIKTLGKEESSADRTKTPEELCADAQLVFCIDTRSEGIRRHVESKGNYETYGYAGFFGIAMDYQDLENDITRKSCPPILPSAYRVTETSREEKGDKLTAFKKRNEVLKFGDYFLKRMKNMLPSAFGFVEGSGFYYGLSLLARTLKPGYFYRLKQRNTPAFEAFCDPELERSDAKVAVPGIPLQEQVAIVKSAFDLMGWKDYAPLVLFVGHGSHSANNPFGSSLDCGACAASPGRHNARMLARLANRSEVRKVLAREHGLQIPESTVFIGAEHNTTTDEIKIFDSAVPASHSRQLHALKADLRKAQQTATRERLGVTKNSVSLAHQKANHWGETRPEWGLAKNAGFIIAPRSLTKNKNLEGHCFLHSYEWELDVSGGALEGIMQGPMVVTQWINNHYYFSTVDNDTFGGGSKITHNITGKFGVVQGNGGDLKMGLPLQSLKESDTDLYHKPLRLSVLIQAPVRRVSEILLRNEHLRQLLDNEWIYLMVMDPLQQNTVLRYEQNLKWVDVEESKEAREPHSQKQVEEPQLEKALF